MEAPARLHFTYEEDPDRANLRQGDIIHRTEMVDEILREVHPHYHDKPDYRFFIVLTQSCDLLRRDGPCNARYITIAAVRPVDLAIKRFIQSLQYDEIEKELGFCDEGRYQRFRDFLESLLNNNVGQYFFLREEPDEGLVGDHCAFLHLSIALKADLHYPTLLDGKILELKVPFQHKLGYLVGQLYSRIATEDWAPDNLTEEQFQEEVKRRAHLFREEVEWLPRPVHKRVLKALRETPDGERTPERYAEVVREMHRTREQHIKELLGIMREKGIALGIDEATLEKLMRRLQSDEAFTGLIK
ncbi:hypothetical protein ACFL3S_08915 [Gemmatimonadota bacterium]